MLYPCNRYLRYDVSHCSYQNLLRRAYRHPEAVPSLAQGILRNGKLKEKKITRFVMCIEKAGLSINLFFTSVSRQFHAIYTKVEYE